MRIYLAGSLQDPPENYPYQLLIRHRLRSFFETPRLQEFESYYKDRDFFLDSGAYSAWRKGVQIDIHKYIDFIQSNNDSIHIYANLDVIGDSRAGWKNQAVMERNETTPLPVYHRFDDVRYLDKCVREYPYFAVGGMAKSTTEQRRLFFDTVFARIAKLNPTVFPKIHGFGLTNVSLMLRYPWYSVDSTSWLMSAATGNCIIPKIVASGLCVTTKPQQVHYSTLLPTTKRIHSGAKHRILSYLSSIGVDIDVNSPLSIFNSAQARQYANVHYFGLLEDYMNSVLLTKKPIQNTLL